MFLNSKPNKPGKKKENFTLRIDEESMKVIKEKSNSDNSSINHVINQLLNTAISWDMYAPCAGWVPMPKPLLLELIDAFSYDDIIKLAHKLGKQIAHDILLFTRGNYDIDSWLEFLNIRSSIAGFQFSEKREGNVINCVLHHGMGKKWTMWFKSFYEIVLNDMNADVSFEISDNTFTMNIKT